MMLQISATWCNGVSRCVSTVPMTSLHSSQKMGVLIRFSIMWPPVVCTFEFSHMARRKSRKIVRFFGLPVLNFPSLNAVVTVIFVLRVVICCGSARFFRRLLLWHTSVVVRNLVVVVVVSFLVLLLVRIGRTFGRVLCAVVSGFSR